MKSYKYLGINLSPSLSFDKHLKDKLGTAKFGLNCTWSGMLSNSNIPLDSKFKIFYATSRAVMCYAAQVWGFNRYETVEKLQRFFLKKLFSLPPNTPNYVLNLEIGMSSMFIYTLKLHFNYILKLFKLPECRLPRIIAEKVISKNVYWCTVSISRGKS